MTVYVDVLILLNAVIDYLIISLTATLTETYIRPVRLVISALVSSLFSLTIFIENMHTLLHILLFCVTAVTVVALAFGIRKKFLKLLLYFISVNIIFCGLMVALWVFVKPKGMLLSNSVVYFDISPLEFIIASCFFYVVTRIVQYIIKKRERYARRCDIKIQNNDKTVNFKALVDTGNSLTDPYGNKPVVITDKETAEEILGNLEGLPSLLLPIHSVIGNGLIPAFSIQKVFVDNKIETPVLLAVADKKFDGDYKGIVSPQIFG
ncbi:MAG: sigma-E processing peptidase SpoIIGA [Acutalibacteraceae bacterium]|nr:sigma-E processing peptidase SpoIIGA [Acutalibacteraceae bacterium]